MEPPILHGMMSRWKRALASTVETDSVIVFSPFLTGRVDTQLTAGKASRILVYTRFDLEVFASGASTIKALRRLIDAYVEVWRIDGLHAKMVIIEGKFLSIGSQNLTDGGKNNKEATIVCDPAYILDVLEATQGWRNGAERVSLEMVELMEKRLKQFGRRFKNLHKQASAEDQNMKLELVKRQEEHLRWLEEEVRREQRERKQELEQRAEREWNERRARWLSARRCANRVRAEMQDDPNHKTYGKACPQRILKVTDGADLIDTFALKRSGKKTPRVYLCCITPGWRIGFVRTAGSRITKVGAGVSWNEPMMVNGINYQVKVNMIWGTDPGKISDSSEANVRFFVSCRGDESQLTLIGRFEMLAWRWLKVDPDTHNAQCDLIMHRFIGNRDEFQRSLLNKMLPDFSYEKPYKSGNATDFFGNVGEFRLWVKRWDEVDDPRLGLPVIIAERLLHV